MKFNKNFIFTIGIGFTFGFSVAYMLLSASGIGGKKEIFLGPPIRPDDGYIGHSSDPHDHDHQVS